MFKAINNATWLTSFMETVEKLDLSRTVKHGAFSIVMYLDVEKELGPVE